MDLEKFFDRVNHDILMSRVAKRVKDKKILKLIRAYLNAGILINGVLTEANLGTPQGGPLSPLLSNILLDDLDKELEKRGHRFCRYADDCNIYVKTERSGARVLESITSFLEIRLKLKVNVKKSAVARPSQRKFLGYSFTDESQPRIRVAKQSVKKFRKKLKEIFRQGRGRNVGTFINRDLNPILRGWINYFSLFEWGATDKDLDGWVRRRLRLIIWEQWKKPHTRYKKLVKAGISSEEARMAAYNKRAVWWNSKNPFLHKVLKNKYFASMGLISMEKQVERLRMLNTRNRLGT